MSLHFFERLFAKLTKPRLVGLEEGLGFLVTVGTLASTVLRRKSSVLTGGGADHAIGDQVLQRLSRASYSSRAATFVDIAHRDDPLYR